MENISDAVLVRQFTEESGTVIPNNPQLMNKEEVNFIIKMVLDEMMELYATVEEPENAKLEMIKMIIDSKNIQKETGEEKELIASQADALVDNLVYCYNASAKKGVNLSSIFKIVHQANMNKRDPTTGKFLRREDGKIIKPNGWKAPDITAEIERQFKEGFF
jgi:predicted HAD superfamily Cof-like phosphohydrolase